MSYPAFEDALKCGDQEALLRLYDAAIAQRDRAEAVLRSLLNPKTSTQTIGELTCEQKQGGIGNSGLGGTTISASATIKPPPVHSRSASESGKVHPAKTVFAPPTLDLEKI